jgi:hypothetical protein
VHRWAARRCAARAHIPLHTISISIAFVHASYTVACALCVVQACTRRCHMWVARRRCSPMRRMWQTCKLSGCASRRRRTSRTSPRTVCVRLLAGSCPCDPSRAVQHSSERRMRSSSPSILATSRSVHSRSTVRACHAPARNRAPRRRNALTHDARAHAPPILPSNGIVSKRANAACQRADRVRVCCCACVCGQ